MGLYDGNRYKSGATVIRMLIDVVSKNGNLLLSIPVKGNGTFTFKAFSIAEPSYSGEVEKVTLLGGGDVEFTHGINGLTIKVPNTKPNDIAPVFRITFKADNLSAYELLQDLIQAVDAASEEEAVAAREALMSAYRSFLNDGVNKGGAFSGIIEANLQPPFGRRTLATGGTQEISNLKSTISPVGVLAIPSKV